MCFVGLVIQHAKCICLITLSSVFWLSPRCFSTFLKGTIFGKKSSFTKMCVLIFSTTLSATFLILSRTERGIVINVLRNLCRVPVILGPGSSVGIATDHGLDDPGSNPGWGRDFLPVQTGPGAHPASCKMGTGSFPRVKCGRDMLLTIHPLLVPRSWKSRATPLPTLWATPGL